MLDNVVISILSVNPFDMNYLRTRLNGLFLLTFLFLVFSCNKDIPVKPAITFVNFEKPDLVKDWTVLSLDLTAQCNGFNDLIASRAMFYMSLTMYESLLPGLEGYQTLQAKINGLNTTLPQPLESKKYNWLIVANQALALVCSDLYKSSGSLNLSKITSLRDKYISSASVGLDEAVIRDSKDLGNEMGWKFLAYASSDGRADYYLKSYPDLVMPIKEGSWIPTSPDYTEKPILPYWGETKPAYLENFSETYPKHILEYSASKQSIIFGEALEVYNLTTNLSKSDIDLINYWNENADSRATPLCHNMLVLAQMLENQDFTLDKAVECLLRMSIAHYDGYILSWQIKFKYDLLRPSSYIKQNISRYFIPEYPSLPIPEFASEKALIYNASAEILAHYFGHRTAFNDLTQSRRSDLLTNKKSFSSFSEMAKEASYSDLYSAVHFRTSIDAGLQTGYDLSQKTLALKLTK